MSMHVCSFIMHIILILLNIPGNGAIYEKEPLFRASSLVNQLLPNTTNKHVNVNGYTYRGSNFTVLPFQYVSTLKGKNLLL